MINYIDEKSRNTASLYVPWLTCLTLFLIFIRDSQLLCLPIVFVTLLRSRGNARNSKFREVWLLINLWKLLLQLNDSRILEGFCFDYKGFEVMIKTDIFRRKCIICTWLFEVINYWCPWFVKVPSKNTQNGLKFMEIVQGHPVNERIFRKTSEVSQMDFSMF